MGLEYNGVRTEQGTRRDVQVDTIQKHIGFYLDDQQQNCGWRKGSGTNHAWIWKKARAVPMPKPKKFPQRSKIAAAIPFGREEGKLFERLLARLEGVLESSGDLPNQFGFERARVPAMHFAWL